jgi:hypothetical protein
MHHYFAASVRKYAMRVQMNVPGTTMNIVSVVLKLAAVAHLNAE